MEDKSTMEERYEFFIYRGTIAFIIFFLTIPPFFYITLTNDIHILWFIVLSLLFMHLISLTTTTSKGVGILSENNFEIQFNNKTITINYDELSALHLYHYRTRYAQARITITKKDGSKIKINAVPGIAIVKKEHLFRAFYKALEREALKRNAVNEARCGELHITILGRLR